MDMKRLQDRDDNIALRRSCDADQPRNFAKLVTVE